MGFCRFRRAVSGAGDDDKDENCGDHFYFSFLIPISISFFVLFPFLELCLADANVGASLDVSVGVRCDVRIRGSNWRTNCERLRTIGISKRNGMITRARNERRAFD